MTEDREITTAWIPERTCDLMIIEISSFLSAQSLGCTPAL